MVGIVYIGDGDSVEVQWFVIVQVVGGVVWYDQLGVFVVIVEYMVVIIGFDVQGGVFVYVDVDYVWLFVLLCGMSDEDDQVIELVMFVEMGVGDYV